MTARRARTAALATAAALLAAIALDGCSRGPPGPAPLDTRHESCARCRMMVSDVHFAAQLVAPAEEPRFFDDVGCLRDWVRDAPEVPRGAVAYVADHRTGQWVAADRAVFVLATTVETPMRSHLLAYADAASRDADPAARGAAPASNVELLPRLGSPRGRP